MSVSRAPATTHPDRTVIDGLQINRFDRGVLEQLHKGGVTGVNATCAVWEGPAETLHAVGDWYQLARHNADLMLLAETGADIVTAKETDRVAVLLGFQNTSPFGDDFRLVEAFHRLGVRVAQLTYNIQNLVGGACYDPTDSGLTRFGHVVVEEMNRVGMLVDLSHVGNRTSRDAIDASTVPVAITHANPTWFVDTPRNKPPEVISALTGRGGVIGACLYPNVIGGETTSRAEFCAMVARLVDEVGVQHVGIGSDCTHNQPDDFVGWLRNGRWQPPHAAPEARWPTWPGWFTGPADLPQVTDGLLEVGLDEDAVSLVMGGNWQRLLDEVLDGDAG